MKKQTLDDILESLTEDAAVMQWMANEGKKRMQGPPLSYKEWHEVLTKVFDLAQEYIRTPKIARLFWLVVLRGIKDLRTAVDAGLRPVEMYDAFHTWWHDLFYQLDPNRLGPGSDFCTPEQTHELINDMVRIAQIVQSQELIGDLAHCRASGDDLVRQQLIASWKNW